MFLYNKSGKVRLRRCKACGHRWKVGAVPEKDQSEQSVWGVSELLMPVLGCVFGFYVGRKYTAYTNARNIYGTLGKIRDLSHLLRYSAPSGFVRNDLDLS